MKSEGYNILIQVLSDISELISNGIFSIDSELEDELIEAGVIDYESDVYEGVIDEAIELIKMLNKIKEEK